MLDRLEAIDARSFVEGAGLRNHFVALVLRRAGDEGGWLTTDPYGLHTVYRAAVGDRTILGNDPQLIADVLRNLGASPSRSESSAAINATLGHLSACRTGFDGVETLPLGHGVDFVGGRARVTRRVRDPWMVPEEPINATIVDHVDLDLRSFMAQTLRSASPIRAELTGGKDSRLILALAEDPELAQRVDYVSYGSADHPDVVVAHQLCERLSLSWCRRDWPPSVGGDVDSIVWNARRSSGQLGIGHVDAFDDDGGLTLSGMMGETMMTNFPNHRAKSMTQTLNVLRRAWEPKGKFLRPDVRQATLRAMVADVESLEDRGCRPSATIDAWYVESRIRRWLGARPTRWQGCVYPLYSVAASEAAFASSRESRQSGELLMTLLGRRSNRIADIEFTKRGLPTNPNMHTDFAAALETRLLTDPKLRARLTARLEATSGEPSLPTYVDELINAAGPSSHAIDVFDTDAMLKAGKDFFNLGPTDRKDLQNSCISFAWLADVA